MTDDAMHNALARLPERLAESFTQEVRRTHVTVSLDDPLGWYARPRTIETRKRLPALPVAIGHAVFFLTLALAGWLR